MQNGLQTEEVYAKPILKKVDVEELAAMADCACACNWLFGSGYGC